MAKKKFKRIIRPATAEERKRHAEIREKVMQEFPPSLGAGRGDSPPGIPAEIARLRPLRTGE